MKISQKEQTQAKERLADCLKPGDTIYTILRHVSQSGMMRHISLYVFRDNKPVYLDYNVSQLLGCPLAKREGLKRSGCGMDMGFDLVYSLSHAIFGDGYELHHHWL